MDEAKADALALRLINVRERLEDLAGFTTPSDLRASIIELADIVHTILQELNGKRMDTP